MNPIKTAAEFELVPAGTVVESSGDGQPVEVPSAGPPAGRSPSAGEGPRLFVIQLDITEQIDQESLELSLWGSPDGQNWGTMPLIKLPQRFYRGSAQMVLDLTLRPEVKFIRARWDVNRWGRGVPRSRFAFHVTARSAG